MIPLPPLQLSMGSSAAASSKGGSARGDGAGALNQGDWVIQTTANGDNGTTTGAKNAAGANTPLYLALAGALAWLIFK